MAVSERAWMWMIIVGTIVSGGIASIAAKTLFQVKADDICDGKQPYFAKPYFLTVAMFIGELCCLPVYHLVVKRHSQRDAVAPQSANGHYASPLLDDDSTPLPIAASAAPAAAADPKGDLPACPTWFFLCLCSFDLTASTLNFIGLLYVSASLNQMFRGSMAVFVALFSLCFLRRRLSLEQWVAIGIVVLGLTAVGFSSYLAPAADDGSTPVPASLVFIGIVLVLAGSALNAFQNTVEELLMKMLTNYREPHPMEIVGWEGLYGTLLSSLIMLPAVYYIPGSDCGGRQENSLDTLYKLQSPKVVALVLAYIVGLGCMNYSSMELSRLLSAVVRNLVSAMRTVFVWMVSVLLFYAAGPSYGERVGLWSIVELCGFILLIGGSVLYSRGRERTLKAPSGKKSFDAAGEVGDGGEEYEEEEEEEEIAINGVQNRAPIIP